MKDFQDKKTNAENIHSRILKFYENEKKITSILRDQKINKNKNIKVFW